MGEQRAVPLYRRYVLALLAMVILIEAATEPAARLISKFDGLSAGAGLAVRRLARLADSVRPDAAGKA